MKKRIIVVLLISAFVLSSCTLVERFEEAKTAYLDSRVEELLSEDAPVDEGLEAEEPVEEAAPEEEAQPVEEAEPEEEAESAEPEAEPKDVDEDVDSEASEEEDGEESEEEADHEDLDSDPEETETDEDTDLDEEPVIESDDPGKYLGEADWMDEMDPGEYYWPLGTDEYMSAAYEDGTLKLQALSEINGWRIASTSMLGDSYIEAVVEIGKCSKTDGYGFIFNVPEETGYNRGYLFGVTCNGKYSLRVWDGLSGENGSMTWLKYYTENEYILQGEDAVNTIGVMTVDDSISLYINGELVDQFVDDTYSEGFFGMYINRDYTENLTINIDKVSYWTDPLE